MQLCTQFIPNFEKKGTKKYSKNFKTYIFENEKNYIKIQKSPTNKKKSQKLKKIVKNWKNKRKQQKKNHTMMKNMLNIKKS